MTPLTRSLAGVAFGAAVMFWLDPASGRRRRARVRERIGSIWSDFNEAVHAAGRDLEGFNARA